MSSLEKISDVSEALGIPSSTLRYWDKTGLINFERGSDNNYRRFSFQTMLEICDIMFYRSLELPLSVIQKIDTMQHEEQMALFTATESALEYKINHLKKVLTRIEQRKIKLNEYNNLKDKELTIVNTSLPAIHKFDFHDKEMVQRYLSEPSLSADILTQDEKNPATCGLFVEQETGHLIRKKDKQKHTYLYGLLWMDKQESTNASHFWLTAQKLGYKGDKLICKYLTSVCDTNKEYRRYFEAWLELAPKQ